MDERTRQFRRDLWKEANDGWVLSIDLLTATGVWMGIGWLLDQWLGTYPWLMLGGALLGFALGMYLLYLKADAQGKAEEIERARR